MQGQQYLLAAVVNDECARRQVPDTRGAPHCIDVPVEEGEVLVLQGQLLGIERMPIEQNRTRIRMKIDWVTGPAATTADPR